MLEFPERKQIRAGVIKQFMWDAHYRQAVCFSCGNASGALKARGVRVLEVAVGRDLKAEHWWSPEDIHQWFPSAFDATSGHLPMPLMVRLARAYREFLGDLREAEYRVPTGSGETIICLLLAYPHITFRAVYECGPGTRYDANAPLNGIVALRCNPLNMSAPSLADADARLAASGSAGQISSNRLER